MLNVAELRACMARKGVTQKAVAEQIGITPKTFYEKMRKGVFGTDEVQIMIDFLSIDDPLSIFFAQEVTL